MDLSKRHKQAEHEEWRSVPNYPVKDYKVSNTGKVKSMYRVVERVFKTGTVALQEVPEKILSPAKTKHGHLQVSLRLDNCKSSKTYYVHELVADAFLGKRPEGMHVCHNDGVPSNNDISNLRYDTPAGNALDRVRHGTDAIGCNNPQSVLSEPEVMHIKYLLLVEGMRQVDVSELLNLHIGLISSISQGKNWAHVIARKQENLPSKKDFFPVMCTYIKRYNKPFKEGCTCEWCSFVTEIFTLEGYKGVAQPKINFELVA